MRSPANGRDRLHPLSASITRGWFARGGTLRAEVRRNGEAVPGLEFISLKASVLPILRVALKFAFRPACSRSSPQETQ